MANAVGMAEINMAGLGNPTENGDSSLNMIAKFGIVKIGKMENSMGLSPVRAARIIARITAGTSPKLASIFATGFPFLTQPLKTGLYSKKIIATVDTMIVMG